MEGKDKQSRHMNTVRIGHGGGKMGSTRRLRQKITMQWLKRYKYPSGSTDIFTNPVCLELCWDVSERTRGSTFPESIQSLQISSPSHLHLKKGTSTDNYQKIEKDARDRKIYSKR